MSFILSTVNSINQIQLFYSRFDHSRSSYWLLLQCFYLWNWSLSATNLLWSCFFIFLLWLSLQNSAHQCRQLFAGQRLECGWNILRCAWFAVVWHNEAESESPTRFSRRAGMLHGRRDQNLLLLAFVDIFFLEIVHKKYHQIPGNHSHGRHRSLHYQCENS